MGTLIQNTFENGTQGATITPANSGVKTGYPVLNGGTAIFDAGEKFTGAFGLKITSAANQNTVTRWDLAAASFCAAYRRPVRIPAAVDTVNPITFWTHRHSAGVIVSLRLSIGGALEVSTNNQTTFTVLRAAGQFTLGGQYEFSSTAIIGASASTGGLIFKMYAPGSAGALIASVTQIGNAVLNSNNFASEDFGILGNAGAAGIVVGTDDAQRQEGGLATTLAAAAASSATTISTAASIPVGSLVGVDTSTAIEVRQVTAVAGSGPYTLTLNAALSASHASGATVTGVPELAAIAASAPTVNAGADQIVAAGTQVNFGGASASAGTVAWTCVGKPDGAADPTINNSSSISNANATGLVGGVYTFRLTATDGGGLTGVDDVLIFVYPANGVTVQVRSAVSSTFTNQGGAASLVAALNDLLPSSYAESSPASGVTQVMRVTMNPHGPGTISGYADGYDSGGDVTRVITVYKEDGSTIVWTDASYPLPSLSSTTLAAAAASGATTVTLAATPIVSYVLEIDTGGTVERRRVMSVAGNVATLDSALTSAHASGAAVNVVPSHPFTIDAAGLAKISALTDRKALIFEIADTGV